MKSTIACVIMFLALAVYGVAQTPWLIGLQWRSGLSPAEKAQGESDLALLGFREEVRLKWSNQVYGFLSSDRIGEARAIPHLSRVLVLAEEWQPPQNRQFLAKPSGIEVEYGLSKVYYRALGIEALHNQVLAEGKQPGEGLHVAFLDDGFHLGHEMFKSLLSENRILDSKDYTGELPYLSTGLAHDTSLVPRNHGSTTLSVVAGRLPGEFFGVTPQANFSLYKTELYDQDYESVLEELYLAAGIERAVGSGARILNISLGYRFGFNDGTEFPFEWLDGDTRPSTLAAEEAARRNCLVVVSVGNEAVKGEDRRFLISAPADADSILAVGALEQDLVTPTEFSSGGPSFDGRIKPDISAPGVLVPGASKDAPTGIEHHRGTSYASPLTAGIAGLLWQLHPQASAMQIRNAILASGSRANNPDNEVGHGLIDGWAAHLHLQISAAMVRYWGSAPSNPKVEGSNIGPAFDALGRSGGKAPGTQGYVLFPQK